MKNNFSRIITLLRKERGLSQKTAASQLQISQALLSHYEKGIRECGLDFLVRCADFYGVSCDYLLGRSPEQTGTTITVDDIPEADSMGKENVLHGSILTTLNKKLIANSLNILFDLISKSNNKTLINEISGYLMLAVYKMFRTIYSANPKNQAEMFNVPSAVYSNFASAAMNVCESKAKASFSKENVNDVEHLKNADDLLITNEILAANYPLFSSSLLNLIQNSESKMNF